MRLNGRFVDVWKPERYEGGGAICDQGGGGGSENGLFMLPVILRREEMSLGAITTRLTTIV